MDILDLIKNRKTIRKYQDKPIPKDILDKIIEAGIWGPSVVVMQPWFLVVIQNETKRKSIYDILMKKSKKIDIGGRILFNSSLRAISGANIIIAIYNLNVFQKFASKFGGRYLKSAKMAELASISATIQNMILTAESLGVGSCWLDAPIICEKDINNVLGVKLELVALLTLGYKDEVGHRAQRKVIEEIVSYI